MSSPAAGPEPAEPSAELTASLRGYLDAIAAGLGNPRERLDRARAKAEQIDRLVTGLFDYARADIDERPRWQTTDLAETVIDATAAFEP